MSNEQSGGGSGFGGGPKKPRATFGDVMLGIPAGGGGEGKPGGRRPEGDRGGRGGERSGGGRGGEGGRAGGERREARPEARPEQKEKRPSGPMVVVRRASGVVETRQAGEAPKSPEATEAAEATPSESVHAEPVEAPVAAAPARPVAPVAPRPSVADEVPENESFADMFEQSAKATGGLPGRRGVRVGEKVTGKIFQLGADTAFVSLGSAKTEAMIDLRELQDAEGVLRLGVGDTVEAHVVETGARGIFLSRTLGKGAASMSMLAEARESGMPVEGMVLAINKGGVEVAIGEVRAFCPISQLDVRFVEKPEDFIGEKLRFRVIEVREKNVVVSRRALLEEEMKAQAAEVRKTLHEGKVVKGKVSSVRDFGAFVDIGGLEGLLPVSELSHVRVGHPSEVVKQGDAVEVEIIRIEAAQPNSPDKSKQRERITLSMRSRLPDPFEQALAEIREGDRLKAKIVRLQAFGAFAELRPGVDGLIHVSALSDKRIAHPRDVVAVGDEVWVEVEKIEPSDRRIGLRRITEEEAQQPAEERAAKKEEVRRIEASTPRPKVGQVIVGKVDRIEPYGIFLAFPGGKGLIPGAETGTERGTDYRRVFSMGQEIKAAIVDIDPSGKIKLSITEAQRAEERADMEAWKATQTPAGGGKKGLGTFADLLKGKV